MIIPRHTWELLSDYFIGPFLNLAALKEWRYSTWQRFVSKPILLLIAGSMLVGCVVYEFFFELVNYVFSFSFVSLGFDVIVAAAPSPGHWFSTRKVEDDGALRMTNVMLSQRRNISERKEILRFAQDDEALRMTNVMLSQRRNISERKEILRFAQDDGALRMTKHSG